MLVLSGLALVGVAALWLTLPDPRPLAGEWPATTAYVELRRAQARREGRELDVRWSPVGLDEIPDHVERAVRVSEDAMFYRHGGIDWFEVWASVREWWSGEDDLRGASTISMQLARNLYLSPERSLLRKARESLVALRLESRLTKARILELYLNVVELGPGVFGVDAAARHYWGVPAAELTTRQAAELAATLPSPLEDNPRTRTRQFLWRTRLAHRRAFGADSARVDTVPRPAAPGAPAPEDAPRDTAGRAPLPSGRPVGDTAPPDTLPDDPPADSAAPEGDAPAMDTSAGNTSTGGGRGPAAARSREAGDDGSRRPARADRAHVARALLRRTDAPSRSRGP